MIESVNELSLPSTNGSRSAEEDPLAQVAQILSRHLESLQWIDSSVRDVEGKVTDVEHRIKESGVASPGLGGSTGPKSRMLGGR